MMPDRSLAPVTGAFDKGRDVALSRDRDRAGWLRNVPARPERIQRGCAA
jgi:hypothetical protein